MNAFALPLRAGEAYDRDAASLASGTSFEGVQDMAQQQFAEDSDLNVLVRRFGINRVAITPRQVEEYSDFTDVVDFHTAQQRIVEARERFMELPARLRDEFDHDPALFLEFVTDPENYEEAQELGLVPPKAAPPPPGPDPSPAPIPG